MAKTKIGATQDSFSNVLDISFSWVTAGGVNQGKTSGLNVEMGGARPISLRKREDF